MPAVNSFTPMLSTEAIVRAVFNGMMAKDAPGVTRLFAPDGILIDPHFPFPRNEGRRAILDALTAAMQQTASFDYRLLQYFESEDHQHAAAEVATGHRVRGAKRPFDFPQVFVFEIKEGQIARLQAYGPHGPHGIVGFFLAMGRLRRREHGSEVDK